MQEAKVTSGDQEYSVLGSLSIGRTPDNTISFPDDSNISRNHVEINRAGEDYFLKDLGSSNGTLINGIRVTGVQKLNNGDFIIVGNSKSVIFNLVDDAVEQDDETADEDGEAAEPSAPEPTPEEKKKNRTMMIGAGGALALAVAIGGGAIYYASGSTCAATARIISPEPGDTISKATDIEVESDDAGCVAKAIFTIDGTEFATSDTEPFEAEIDPKDHPDLADGFDHVLGIVLIDKYGERISEPEPVLLAFETRKVEPPVNTEIVQGNTNTASVPKGKELSLVEIQQLSDKLAKQLSPAFAYNVSNKQFLQEVQKRAAEYAEAGYFDRAAQYRDAIRVGFVREQNLEASFAFYLAMSRSKFDPRKQGNEEGIFRMANDFVTANSYNGLCGTQTISDASQECAANAAGLYMKTMVFTVFDKDYIYAAAAFGKTTADASAWKTTLPANRSDLWNVIKSPQEREQLVRFFAAGIVAENPQKFGLNKDRPLSELYRITS
jgi:hypothetical protein